MDGELVLLDGDREELDLLEVRSRDLPLVSSCWLSFCSMVISLLGLSLLVLSLLWLFLAFECFLILPTRLVTQKILRQVERWNCAE